MRPRFLPQLVNGRMGDPGLLVRLLDERRALLFDLGDLAALAPRALLRVSDAFVSHAHVDHFIGFDRLLRLLVGRAKRLRLWGPPRFADRVAARLAGYEWNLVHRFRDELVIEVAEFHGEGDGDGRLRRSRFRLATGFAREGLGEAPAPGGLLLADPGLSVHAAPFDHDGLVSLGFRLAEPAHLNIWKTRLAGMGLAPGRWLAGLKRAIREGAPDGTLLPVAWASGRAGPAALPLGRLRPLVSETPGQKIAYLTDLSPTPENEARAIAFVRGVDVLFIEAPFRTADAVLARERGHLTTALAGRIARAAGAARVEPFHFSPRYEREEEAVVAEVLAAFEGGAGAAVQGTAPGKAEGQTTARAGAEAGGAGSQRRAGRKAAAGRRSGAGARCRVLRP